MTPYPFYALLGLGLGLAWQALAGPLPLEQLRLPPGFSISLYAYPVPDARSMTLGADGTLFVATRKAGRLYAVRDRRGDGQADAIETIATGLNMPNGIAFHQGDLYVAENHRLMVYRDAEAGLPALPSPEIIRDDLPRERHHGWRYLAIGPDARLYLSIGAPCNVCDEPGFAEIRSMKLDGTDQRVEASGVRNSIGFDWHPASGKLWFSDNGRDWLGDDAPPDELNRLDERGQHFGFPYCHGGDLPDPEFGAGKDCRDYQAPARCLQAHVAPLGIHFIRGSSLPAQYRQQLLVAEHGSWNRSSKVGYRVALAVLDGDQVSGYRDFISGWLQGERAWGRPVAVLELPGGDLLVSDDGAGAIYRVRYQDEPRP